MLTCAIYDNISSSICLKANANAIYVTTQSITTSIRGLLKLHAIARCLLQNSTIISLVIACSLIRKFCFFHFMQASKRDKTLMEHNVKQNTPHQGKYTPQISASKWVIDQDYRNQKIKTKKRSWNIIIESITLRLKSAVFLNICRR